MVLANPVIKLDFTERGGECIAIHTNNDPSSFAASSFPTRGRSSNAVVIDGLLLGCTEIAQKFHESTKHKSKSP
jgi:hypothetical protein